MKINTLLFDIGDVLIDIDWQRGYRKLLGHMRDADGHLMTLEEITEQLHPGPYGSIWDEFSVNKINKTEFLTQVIDRTDYRGEIDLLEAELTDLFEPIDERINLLNRLTENKDITVALVSDTNDMHMSHIESKIPAIFFNIPLERRFYSHRLGLKKKLGKEVYETVLNSLGKKPENVLMIDDRIDNRVGADAIGLNFLHIQKHEDLATALINKPYELSF